ncbi:hypothetical protein SLEP1_g4458 [Rubroshorea leprosula]|uniref:Uncharacterized protein n=1 Tax=Rubroshorea leprosula TaxID=152421 RepID=A0AAV5HP89_9ROSI|nr:hypothetical protein SLEP1_g4458 [Rubroshorea leprosula]
MASFHDAQEFRGNQGEDEEVDVILVEPIAMIMLLELQDSPRTAIPKSSASSSAGGDSDDCRASTSSSDIATEETPSEGYSAPVASVEGEVAVPEGWESKGEQDGAATVKGYKKLEEMVRRYQIPKTILIRAGTPNEKACSVSRTGWVPVLGMLAKAVVFRLLFLCRLCPSTNGTRWYYIFGREKMMRFTNIINKVTRWKRQFVFVHDTRTERINNELAARLSEWRTPNTYMNYPQLASGDVDLKNRLLNHVKARGLVDLEALVTPEQIALLGILERQRQRAQGSRNCGAVSGSQCQTHFDERPPAALGRSSQHRSSRSAQRPCAEQRVEPALSSSRRCVREDSNAEDDIPLIRRRTTTGSQPAPAAAARAANVPPTPACEVVEPALASSSVAGPRIAYPDGFSYVRTECQAAMLQGMQNFVPPADWLCAKGHVQQHGGHAALIKLMDAFSYTVALFECEQGARVQNHKLEHNCKQLAFEKASLADEVNELKEELERAQVEKETGIQAAREELGRVEERARKAESDKERTLHKLSALRERRDVCLARAQGAEWLVGAEMFQDAVAVASANTTTDSFNKVRGKVLQVRADFPMGELAFFKGEEIDEEGKSLAQPADTQDMPVEPSSTPPSAQPHPQPTSATVPTPSPSYRPSPAWSVSAPNDAFIPVDLTDD